MKAIYSAAQRAHDPRHFLSSGAPKPNPEQPGRVDALLGALDRLGLAVETPQDRGLGPIAALHTAEYLAFLRTIHQRWQRIPEASDEVIPNIRPDRRTASYPHSAVGQAGYHMADTAWPISTETWGSACWSAQSAVAAADLVLGGASGLRAVPPPGPPRLRRPRRGVFAFSATPPSPPSAARARGCGRRSSTSTCTTATARRASSTPGPTC